MRADLVLEPDEEQDNALHAYVERYVAAANWLAEQVRARGVGNQVQLHRMFYALLREEYGLPSQAAVLCVKHGAKLGRIGGVLAAEGPVPYDRHLYSLRAVDRVSLATLAGRIVLPCLHTGYGGEGLAVGDAELAFVNGIWVFSVQARLPERSRVRAQTEKEAKMSDKLIGRISRLIAGVAHNAVSQAEQLAPIPAMEQAVREIDEAAREVKAEIGKSEAQKFNLNRRREELQNEHAKLVTRIETALEEEADELAEAGVARQVDIEKQVTVLERGVADAEADITKLGESLSALQASRREAMERLRDLKAAKPAGPQAAAPGGRGVEDKAAAAIAGAERLGEDLTGVPGAGPRGDHQDLEDLEELHRKRLIRERLDKLRDQVRGDG